MSGVSITTNCIHNLIRSYTWYAVPIWHRWKKGNGKLYMTYCMKTMTLQLVLIELKVRCAEQNESKELTCLIAHQL